MGNESPFLLIKQLEAQLHSLLKAVDLDDLELKVVNYISKLKHELSDARLDIRDYELSETRQAQLDYAQISKKRLTHVHEYILVISEYNIFSAVDVAQTSAQLEQIVEILE